MSPSKKILDLLVKVDRASQHLIDLQLKVQRFFDPPGPYEIIPEDDSLTRERTYYLRVHKRIPSEFSAIIGDIAQNLRSALDHLAWHLVQTSPVTPKARDRDIYFPIFEDASEYQRGKLRKIEGMTDAAIQAIDDIKPYGRLDKNNLSAGIGNLALYWLSALNVQDKHRLLIPAWAAAPAHSITKTKRTEMAETLREAFGSESARVMIGSSIDFSVPLEDGSKLCTLPISEVDDDMQFRFQMAFGEPASMRGKEILSTLNNMHRIVREIVFDFDRKGLL
ncbi:hypothetical protein ACFPT7_03020 [Acidicapsa dinghuensis]|uniref:Uncharacterized protein n=1 Tax=Acidicapsa dinghuensis TaxID=2218256 RepID=A0ABW1EBA5_9BACT|nr:hypothetical protein [Acidicapsa dinghuensis]